MSHVSEIIVSPLLTEKTASDTEKNNRYGFVVKTDANKYQIKDAVEKLFNVKVLNVKTSILPGKLRRAGRSVFKTTKTKKAFVQLEEGQKIEFFKGI